MRGPEASFSCLPFTIEVTESQKGKVMYSRSNDFQMVKAGLESRDFAPNHDFSLFGASITLPLATLVELSIVFQQLPFSP